MTSGSGCQGCAIQRLQRDRRRRAGGESLFTLRTRRAINVETRTRSTPDYIAIDIDIVVGLGTIIRRAWNQMKSH